MTLKATSLISAYFNVFKFRNWIALVVGWFWARARHRRCCFTASLTVKLFYQRLH